MRISLRKVQVVRTFVAFLRLSRLKFLTGGVLGVALGAAMVYHRFQVIAWNHLIFAQIAVTSFQLMTHYTNDYYDREGDALAVRTPFSGGSGVFARGELSPQVALIAAACCLFTGMLSAGIFFWAGHNVLAFALGALIAFLAWSYSAPPLRLLARGAGELTTALIVGMLVPLFSYACETGTITLLAVLSTLPAAFAMFVMMISVEIPDIAADAATGKRNLLVRFGRHRAVAMLGLAAAGIMSGAMAAYLAGAPWTLLVAALLVLPLCGMQFRNLRARSTSGASIALTGVAIFVVMQATSVAAFALGR